MPYDRVIPRDLFNEAKLLKALGQLSLLIHDRKAPQGLRLELDFGGAHGFAVDQHLGDGSLYAHYLTLYYRGFVVSLSSPYNDRSPYPLTFEFDNESGDVFNDDGTLSDDFLATFTD